MESSNPLERMILITKAIKPYEFDGKLDRYRGEGGHFLALPAISWALGRETDSNGIYETQDLLNDYITVLDLIAEAQQFIAEKSSSKSRGTNHSLTWGLFKPYFGFSPESIAASIHQMDYSVFANAQIVSDNLWDENTLVPISQDDLQKLKSQIDELEEAILASSIDKSLQDRMVKTLSILRLALSRINTTGHEDVLGHLESLLGQSVVAVTASTPEKFRESQSIFTRTFDLMKSTKDVIDAASTIYPALKAATDFALRVLGNGD